MPSLDEILAGRAVAKANETARREGEIFATPRSGHYGSELERRVVTTLKTPPSRFLSGLLQSLGQSPQPEAGEDLMSWALRTPGVMPLGRAKAEWQIGGLPELPRSPLASRLSRTAEGKYRFDPETVARIGEAHRLGASVPHDWSGISEELLTATGGHQGALDFARFFGATSPKTPVPKNTREAVIAFLHAIESGRAPLTAEKARAMGLTMVGAKVPGLNRALQNLPLEAPKTEAMARLMAGEERIPLDVHALWAAGSPNKAFAPEVKTLRQLFAEVEGKLGKTGKPKGGAFTVQDIYDRVEQAYGDALREVSADPVNISFAQMWEGARVAKGLKPQKSPIDILRAKGLLGVGAMLDRDLLKKTLESKGWGAAAIAAVLGAVEAQRALSE